MWVTKQEASLQGEKEIARDTIAHHPEFRHWIYFPPVLLISSFPTCHKPCSSYASPIINNIIYLWKWFNIERLEGKTDGSAVNSTFWTTMSSGSVVSVTATPRYPVSWPHQVPTYASTWTHTDIIVKNKINFKKLLGKKNCTRSLENIVISSKYFGAILMCKFKHICCLYFTKLNLTSYLRVSPRGKCFNTIYSTWESHLFFKGNLSILIWTSSIIDFIYYY